VIRDAFVRRVPAASTCTVSVGNHNDPPTPRAVSRRMAAPPGVAVLKCGAIESDAVREIFARADRNRDGLVSGEEAVSFFATTGLDQRALAAVWNKATASQPGGLTPPQFSRALRLVSLIQTGCAFTDEFVAKALEPQTGLQLPTPKIGESFMPAGGFKAAAQSPQHVARGAPTAARVRFVVGECLCWTAASLATVITEGIRVCMQPTASLTLPPGLTPGCAVFACAPAFLSCPERSCRRLRLQVRRRRRL
jgi:hypothetical protein